MWRVLVAAERSDAALVSKTSTRHSCNLLLSIRYIVISWLEKGGFIEQKYRNFIYGSIWHNISTMQLIINDLFGEYVVIKQVNEF